jgi:hypothetical protein
VTAGRFTATTPREEVEPSDDNYFWDDNYSWDDSWDD